MYFNVQGFLMEQCCLVKSNQISVSPAYTHLLTSGIFICRACELIIQIKGPFPRPGVSHRKTSSKGMSQLKIKAPGKLLKLIPWGDLEGLYALSVDISHIIP